MGMRHVKNRIFTFQFSTTFQKQHYSSYEVDCLIILYLQESKEKYLQSSNNFCSTRVIFEQNYLSTICSYLSLYKLRYEKDYIVRIDVNI